MRDTDKEGREEAVHTQNTHNHNNKSMWHTAAIALVDSFITRIVIHRTKIFLVSSD
jgi:hypothetical protein